MRALAYAFTEGRSPTRANHAAMLVDGLLRHGVSFSAMNMRTIRGFGPI